MPRGVIDLSSVFDSAGSSLLPQHRAPTGGLSPLNLSGIGGSARDGFLAVSSRYDPRMPAPLLVCLHGAGCSGKNGGQWLWETLRDEELGAIGLLPDARGSTWDMIRSDYGPDVEYLTHALRFVLAHYNIDRRRIVLAGFSDGASYALSLGLSNGTLFPSIAAFSPGYMRPTRREGKPRVFVAHGTRDGCLNIDRCSRTLVPRLQAQEYEVRFVEFDGTHTVRAQDGVTALRYLLQQNVE